MTIEFHEPQGRVKEWVIEYVKKNLIQFHHRDKEISRAQVYFKEQNDSGRSEKICEIDLTIYGNALFVHRSGESFEQASRDAIEALATDVEVQIRKQSEPPDEIVSTVKV